MKRIPMVKVYLEELDMEVKVRVATVTELENGLGITQDSKATVADFLVDKIFNVETNKQLFKNPKELKDTLTNKIVESLFSTYTGVPHS